MTVEAAFLLVTAAGLLLHLWATSDAFKVLRWYSTQNDRRGNDENLLVNRAQYQELLLLGQIGLFVAAIFTYQEIGLLRATVESNGEINNKQLVDDFKLFAAARTLAMLWGSIFLSAAAFVDRLSRSEIERGN